MAVFEIPEEIFPAIQKRINLLNKRARKHKIQVPTVEVLEKFEKSFRVYDALARIRAIDDDRCNVYLPMLRVEFSNPELDLGSWRTVGWKELVRVNGKTRIVHTGEVPTPNKGTDLCCDHCGFERRRKTSVILRNKDTNETVEVGLSCMKAFTGVGLSDEVLNGLSSGRKIAAAIYESSSLDFLGHGFSFGEEIEAVLAVGNDLLKTEHFVSSAVARETGETPTWRLVYDALANYRNPDLPQDNITVTAADFLTAEDIKEFFLERAEQNHFFDSTARIINKGVAGVRDIAVLVASVNIYRTTAREEADRKVLRALATGSEHVGDIGERVEFIGKVKAIKSFEGRYGQVHYVTMLDQHGNALLWKTGSPGDLEVGHAYNMKGTIKDHRTASSGIFKDMNETVLSRVSVTSEIGYFEEGNVSTPESEVDEDHLQSFGI